MLFTQSQPYGLRISLLVPDQDFRIGSLDTLDHGAILIDSTHQIRIVKAPVFTLYVKAHTFENNVRVKASLHESKIPFLTEAASFAHEVERQTQDSLSIRLILTTEIRLFNSALAADENLEHFKVESCNDDRHF
jgi:hypothetical protein